MCASRPSPGRRRPNTANLESTQVAQNRSKLSQFRQNSSYGSTDLGKFWHSIAHMWSEFDHAWGEFHPEWPDSAQKLQTWTKFDQFRANSTKLRQTPTSINFGAESVQTLKSIDAVGVDFREEADSQRREHVPRVPQNSPSREHERPEGTECRPAQGHLWRMSITSGPLLAKCYPLFLLEVLPPLLLLASILPRARDSDSAESDGDCTQTRRSIPTHQHMQAVRAHAARSADPSSASLWSVEAERRPSRARVSASVSGRETSSSGHRESVYLAWGRGSRRMRNVRPESMSRAVVRAGARWRPLARHSHSSVARRMRRSARTVAHLRGSP